MLRKLLALLAEEGPLSVDEAARRLGTEPELVRAMLRHLQRSGRGRVVSGWTCGQNRACRVCPLRLWCAPEAAPVVWRLALPAGSREPEKANLSPHHPASDDP